MQKTNYRFMFIENTFHYWHPWTWTGFQSWSHELVTSSGSTDQLLLLRVRSCERWLLLRLDATVAAVLSKLDLKNNIKTPLKDFLGGATLFGIFTPLARVPSNTASILANHGPVLYS